MEFVVVLDFGFTEDPDVPSTIHDLGDCILNKGAEVRKDMIILAQSATYEYLCEASRTLAESGRLHEIDVAQSGADNGGGIQDGGSYFVLKRAYEMMAELDLEGPPYDIYLMAHALHMPRVVRQAQLVGFRYTISCYDIPTKLYPAAAQWWCRYRPLWYLREIAGFIPLKLAKQI